jgi:hypothetical protein
VRELKELKNLWKMKRMKRMKRLLGASNSLSFGSAGVPPANSHRGLDGRDEDDD